MVIRKAALALLASTSAATAQDDPLTTILDEISVLSCAIGSDVGLIAYRERPNGEIGGLGGLLGAQIVKDGETITILLDGADVLSISGGSATSIRGGVASQGVCTDAGPAFEGLVGALLSTGLDGAQGDLLVQLEAARSEAALDGLRDERMRRALVAAQAEAAEALDVARIATQGRADAAAQAQTFQASMGSLHRTVDRLENRIVELEAELEASQAAVSTAEADAPCAQFVRDNFERIADLEGDLPPINRQAIQMTIDQCRISFGPP